MKKIAMTVQETNRYAKQEIDAARVMHKSRLMSWETYQPRRNSFFGIKVYTYTGLVVKPEIQFYWSKSMLHDAPFMPKLMSRERFVILHRLLHYRQLSSSTFSKQVVLSSDPCLTY